MTGLQIAMIMIGIVCLIGSFFVSEKLSKADLEEMKKMSDEEIKEAKENPLHKAPDHVYIYRSFIPFHSHDFHDQRSISGKILCVKKDGNSSGSKGSAESDQHGFYDRGRCGKRARRIVF